MRVPLLFLLLLTPALAGAQVFKCKGRSGETVYSQDPCDARAQPHVLRDGQAAGNPLRLDRQCMSQASARIYAGANDRIATLQHQIQELAAEGNHATRIAQLHQSITAEHNNAKRAVSQARAGCLREPVVEPAAAPVAEGNQSDS